MADRGVISPSDRRRKTVTPVVNTSAVLLLLLTTTHASWATSQEDREWHSLPPGTMATARCSVTRVRFRRTAVSVTGVKFKQQRDGSSVMYCEVTNDTDRVVSGVRIAWVRLLPHSDKAIFHNQTDMMDDLLIKPGATVLIDRPFSLGTGSSYHADEHFKPTESWLDVYLIEATLVDNGRLVFPGQTDDP